MVSAWSELQERGIEAVRDALRRRRSVCAVAPTGFGKTRIASRVLKMASDKGTPWVFLTHRRLLFGQTIKAFDAAGLSFGCIAAGWKSYANPDAIGQVCMLPTLAARLKSDDGTDWERLPAAGLVLVDEWHANKNGFAKEVVQRYRDSGARIVGLTATPVGLADVCEELVIIANNTQAREVGALLPAVVYTPDEVDLGDVKPVAIGEEFSQDQLAARFKRHQVVGRVYEHWLKLNPQQLPAIGFAPGVHESMWFCDEFIRRGVKCAHIDGEKVYLGERDEAGQPIIYGEEMRQAVEQGSRDGTYKVVWNRFVLREGVDWPWIYHLILATAFAEPCGWRQVCGRALRFWPEYDHVLITDHGGSVYRPGLGDPNADVDWTLGNTNASLVKESKEKMQQADEAEQLKCCPNCNRPVVPREWLANGKACPWCQFKFTHSVRNVIQTDGTLRKVRGNAVKVKPPQTDQSQKAWDSLVFPSKKSKNRFASTFEQVLHRFHREFPQFRVQFDRSGAVLCRNTETGESVPLKRVPPPGSPLWKRRVRDVEWRDLHGN